jgi:hypothetical protein
MIQEVAVRQDHHHDTRIQQIKKQTINHHICIIILTFAAYGWLELEANTVKKRRTVRLLMKIISISLFRGFIIIILLISDC